jgi:hypothetical protein
MCGTAEATGLEEVVRIKFPGRRIRGQVVYVQVQVQGWDSRRSEHRAQSNDKVLETS